MKLAKRILTAGVALALTLGLSVPVFAEPAGEQTGGTITINDAIPGQTYSIYQIAYLESYNAASGAYAYKANPAWQEWLEAQDEYVDVDDQGYVTWVYTQGEGGVLVAADAAEFAKAALEYAQTLVGEDGSETEQIAPDDTQIAPAAGENQQYSTVSFTDLLLGYYLVDSSAGALCSLDTTSPTAIIQEKNEVPTIEKDDTNATDTSSPSVGDTVNFQITINAKPGAQNYVLHDSMGNGLSLVANSIAVYVGSVAEGNELENADNVNYVVTTAGLEPGCDFEIKFTETYLNSITENTTLIVTYSATLTADAIIGEDAVTNEAQLDYGDGSYTTDTTVTEVYSFDLVKTDEEDKILDGAQFELYDALTGGNKINLVKTSDGQYRVASATEVTDDFESAVIETVDGVATIDGLGNGTYYLQEIKAPNGYNLLTGRARITISGEDNNATVTDGSYVTGGVQVENVAGSLLPTTGGMGTTILYIAGAALVLGAGVTLVVRRRMNSDR